MVKLIDILPNKFLDKFLKRYNLKLRILNDDQILLVYPNYQYVLSINYHWKDLGTINIVFYEIKQKTIAKYNNICLFLHLTRDGSFELRCDSSHSDLISDNSLEDELSEIIDCLESLGEDILIGNNGWMDDYRNLQGWGGPRILRDFEARDIFEAISGLK